MSDIEVALSPVNKQELQNRTKLFALRVFKLVDALPSTTIGRVVANQLVRSATSVGANYRGACRARSRTEFTAKLGVALEEADESLYWLELINDGELMSRKKIDSLRKKPGHLLPFLRPAENRR